MNETRQANPLHEKSTAPSTGRQHALRKPGVWALVAVVLIVSFLFDHEVYHLHPKRDRPNEDLYNMTRLFGYLPVWWLVSLALACVDWPRRAVEPIKLVLRRGVALATCTTSAALLAEVVKMLVRRVRPDLAPPDAYAFRAYADHFFHTGGLGLPSSHTIVAFAAAFALGRLFPRTWWMWYLWAGACAWSRIIVGAHYLSDVAVAAVLAWLLVSALWPVMHKPIGKIHAGTAESAG